MRTLIVNIIYLSILITTSSYAWDNKWTHPDLSEYTASKYFTASNLFGEGFIDQSINGMLVRDLIRAGAKLEDSGSAWQFVNGTATGINHFHNPAKPTLSQAGLTDRANGISALWWAQNGPYQTSKGWKDWSWQRVRQEQFNYLTGTDAANRDTAQANMLVGLGHQMHLVQDMGHPSHIRNNTHILDAKGLGGFETWTSKNDIRLLILDRKDNNGNLLFPVPNVTVDLTKAFDETHSYEGSARLAPVARLSDTRTYRGTTTPTVLLDQGLAEYTNSNFFSQDTIFAAERFSSNDKYYFPYPRKEATDIQAYLNNTKPVQTGRYISKTGEGEQLTYLAREGVATRFWRNTLGTGKRFYGSFKLDEACYQDYAQKILPRAVGYSAALLDHFFRGKLKITTSPGDISFRSVKVRTQNDTLGESMGVGEVTLVISYKKLTETVRLGGPSTLEFPVGNEYIYKIAKLSNVDLTNPQELTFDFSGDALPQFWDDMVMQLVFKGKLGNEENSVAVSPWVAIDGVYSDMALSLPSSGLYAKTTDNTSFKEVRLTAQADVPGGLSGGYIHLAVQYRQATSDPFRNLPVDTQPTGAYAYIIRKSEKNGVAVLPEGVPVELAFDLSSAPIPVTATDIKLDLVYTNSSTSKVSAVGYHDISEPTPVDIFNNADYVCLGGQWYPAGDPATVARADEIGNQNGVDDDTDTNKHAFGNIYIKYSSTDSPIMASPNAYDFYESGPMNPNSMLRLGHILSDYTFKYNSMRSWLHVYPGDTWHGGVNVASPLYDGSGVTNPANASGNYLMYNMRGRLMWGSAGFSFENAKLPSNTTCDWATLPQNP